MVKENHVNLYDVDDWGYNNDDNEDHHDDDEVEKKKDGGGVGEGSFFCTDLSMSKRKTTETGSTYRWNPQFSRQSHAHQRQ